MSTFEDFQEYTWRKPEQKRTPASLPTFSDPFSASLEALTSMPDIPLSTSAKEKIGGFQGWAPYQSTTSTTSPTSSITGDKKEAAVLWALSKVGKPYVYGAKGLNDTFDCSGLAFAAYKSLGINVPGSTQAWLSSNRQTIDKNKGERGDIIITGSKNSPSGRHARIITANLGNGKYKVVEAKGKNYGVVESTYTTNNDLINIYRAKNGGLLKFL